MITYLAEREFGDKPGCRIPLAITKQAGRWGRDGES